MNFPCQSELKELLLNESLVHAPYTSILLISSQADHNIGFIPICTKYGTAILTSPKLTTCKRFRTSTDIFVPTFVIFAHVSPPLTHYDNLRT
jgi:hypothetical protein